MEKIKTIAEYQQLAKRTCPSLGDKVVNGRHMTLGVITEIGEVLDIFKKYLAYKKPMDLVNLGEELADIAWYIVNNATFIGVTLETKVNQEAAYDEELRRFLHEDVMLDENMAREHKCETLLLLLASGYTPEPNLHSDFELIEVQIAVLMYVAELYELDFFQCLTNNIEKLKVRYPEKFTEEAALNRDLKAERTELEK